MNTHCNNNITINDVKIDKAVYCIFNICFAILCFFILNLLKTDYQIWLSVFAVIVAITFILNIFLLRKRGYTFISFFVIFIILLYLFHFGQVILYGFFPSYKTTGINFIKVGSSSITNSLLFSYIIINFIVAGGILVKGTKATNKVKIISRNHYFFIALFFICISLPMQLYITIKSIGVSQSLGYSESLHVGFSGAFSQIANFYIIGFVMFLLLNRNNMTRKTTIFICEICFLLFSMLSGSRIYAMTAMIIIFIVYFNISKFSLTKKIVMFIGMLLILQFIVAIAKLRETADFNVSTIIHTMFNPNNNVFLNILEEFGSSIASVSVTIEQVPSRMQFSFGITYLKSFAGVLINIPGFDVYSIVDSACYIKQLSDTLAFGGSLIGELYYNFGYYLSLPIALLIGYVAGNIDRKTMLCISKGLNLELPMLIMVMYTHIIWVRGYFSGIIRAVAWSAIIIYCLYKLYIVMFSRREVKKHAAID